MWNILPKTHWDSSLTWLSTESHYRVCPKYITHNSFFWWLNKSINFFNIVKSNIISAWKPSMANHNSFVKYISQRKTTKKLRESFINSNIFIFSLDLSFKSINHIYLLCLVVASRHMKDIFIYTFPSNQCKHTLNWKWPSINKISIEQVFIFLCRNSIYFIDIKKIVILSMYISTYGYLLLLFNIEIN